MLGGIVDPLCDLTADPGELHVGNHATRQSTLSTTICIVVRKSCANPVVIRVTAVSCLPQPWINHTKAGGDSTEVR